MGVIIGLCYDNKLPQFLVDDDVKLHGIVKNIVKTVRYATKAHKKP
ncbi:Uncharacterised protein [Moraxella veridica]|uniref:Uncharacterized protein n=1 Tax=Moraxella catarrhalis TaxID=480 RepID=A0A7Z0UY96_MORCA|nr:hypothetical protein AO382_1275 [Moraxella catarrhalis]STY82770.1 Uncharacterised protein [Moraxella catarrhalis]